MSAIEPATVVALAATALAALAYGRGVSRVWSRAGRGRAIRRWQVASFTAGASALALAILPPIADVAHDLLSVHMVQHEMLIAIAAPLMAVADPGRAWTWALPVRTRRSRRRVVRVLWGAFTRPAAACAIHAAAFWIWHAPALYDRAVEHDWLHGVEHATFFVTAVLLWASLWQARHAGGRALAAVYIFFTALQSGGLGALLTIAPRPWYPIYAHAVRGWPFTPLEDQQLAGLLMWVVFGAPLALAGLACLALALRDSARRVSFSSADALRAQAGPQSRSSSPVSASVARAETSQVSVGLDGFERSS